MLLVRSEFLAHSAETEAKLEAQTLRFLWSPHAYLHVNANDVTASFKALAATVGQRRGYQVSTTVEVGDDAKLQDLIRKDQFDLLIVDSWTYLSLDAGTSLTPHFIGTDQDRKSEVIGKEYLLMVRADSNYRSVEQLHGTDLTLFEAANASLGRPWLRSLLATRGQTNENAFFASIASVGKPSAAVLPVFFGKQPACVVDRASFLILQELNPQVGQSLRAIARSSPLVDGVVCLRKSPWNSERFRHDLLDVLTELHHEPAGQQLLGLVKATRLLPFQDDFLDEIRRLRAVVSPQRPSTAAGPSISAQP